MSQIEITVAMKVKYLVTEAKALESYGTTDPDQMAAIDEENLGLVPDMLAEIVAEGPTSVSVTARAVS